MKSALVNLILLISLIANGAGAENVKGHEPALEHDPAVQMSSSELWARKTLAQMSLEDKIGQMMVTGIEKEYMTDEEEHMIRMGRVGGLVFLGHNIKSEDQFKTLIQSLPTPSIPLFLSVDQEGGRVERLPSQNGPFMSAYSLGQKPELAYDQGEKLGQSVKAYGLNLNFAPVLDVFSNPDNKVIGTRAFGSDPDLVARVGTDVMEGIKNQGVIPCVKHFPGHGDTVVDSHVGLPTVNHNLERLMSFEWRPFKEAIDEGAPMVMTAHILVSAIDSEYPATLSEKVINGHLRKSLGFEGVVITDDLVMGAISSNYSDAFVARQALVAGVDLLLVSNNDKISNMTQAIKNSVNTGEISVERIDESVFRILRLKHDYLMIPSTELK